jgi:Zn-dependent M28 family amino/carboxypeptidase
LVELSIDVDNEYFKEYRTKNIAAFLQGETDSFIVFSAHYDHLGEMGKGIYFPGANDNASGVALVLNLVKHFAKNKKKLKYSIAFLFFSGEELGLLGAKYYANNPLFPLSKIKFLVNLDMVGSGDKGIQL